MRIAILDDIHQAYAGTAGVARLRERAEVVIFAEPFGHPSALAGFEAVVANRERTRFPRELLEALPDLRVIAQTGNHVYHIDMAAARERGIVVAKAAGGFSIGAAELTIGLAIAVMRGIVAKDAEVKRGVWQVPMGPVLASKTMGIVGLGKVGAYVARLARAFDMRVLAWGPRLTDERAAEAGAERRDLDDLLRESDVVSVHATLSNESRGLLDARRLDLMRRGSYLVNTARGPIVDEAALVQALESGHLAGAGLDVFDEEPLPAGHPLTRLPNVLLTPHIGWPTDQAYARFADAAADALIAYMDGDEVPRFDERH